MCVVLADFEAGKGDSPPAAFPASMPPPTQQRGGVRRKGIFKPSWSTEDGVNVRHGKILSFATAPAIRTFWGEFNDHSAQ
jgi:hypothetical protein